MVTGLEKFKKRMEPAKELYAGEIENFTKKYDSLGEMSIKEIQISTHRIMFFLLKRLMEPLKRNWMKSIWKYPSI